MYNLYIYFICLSEFFCKIRQGFNIDRTEKTRGNIVLLVLKI